MTRKVTKFVHEFCKSMKLISIKATLKFKKLMTYPIAALLICLTKK